MNIEFYQRYKNQNPKKYVQKFGNKTPGELADKDLGIIPAPKPVEPIKVEFAAKKEIVKEFVEVDMGGVVGEVTIEDLPKKRKLKTK